ncbi:hypothetical protein CGT98_16330 [Vibrio metoecus]|uniref:Proline and glycine rich transmembrane protein gene in bax n=2 Tax=Vibrio metoecus TaxID=1481663 RepID=A0A271VNC8_VIBMT|nr:hypothetical protein CGU03_16225 [Vibrio metoecus]PAR22116.1 hypothetical protein CGU02_16595 [Vibrio metoecus]PAR27672.1 hypothetical protein CGU00_13525 [Vibrio metoecus]PAR31383.1 hypothetical protein CGT99_12350 [Vibrio metoecus]PAR37927.1 hypothetical protein CGT98_16330 [Vibrio metoecus]
MTLSAHSTELGHFMNNDIEREFNLGGSVDKALSGSYELKVGDVLKEAWGMTVKHFINFTPAIFVLIVVQLAIFYLAFKLQIGDLSVILSVFEQGGTVPEGLVQAMFIANFSYEVISAPIYAGISLMAMSHAAGLRTQTRHMSKGLQFTIPVILATLFSLMLQGVAGMILPFLSMYLSIAFSNSLLLICEKKVPPMQSLLLSLRAANKKIFPLIAIYSVLMVLFIMAVFLYGIGLVLFLPFFFHVKGIIYRNMFGIRLKIIATDHPKDDQGNHSQSSGVFDA